MDEETEQQQSANFYRLISLLIDLGGEALRDVLLKEIPQNQLQNVIQQNTALLTSLKNIKVLTDPQYSLLQETPPDPTKFDISLLVALLRNLCQNIEPPKPDWKNAVPDSNDFSMGAELLRIKNIRNTKMHVSTTLMPQSTFQPLWIDLAAIIIRIANKVSPECGLKFSKKIVFLEGTEIDPSGEKEKQLLKTLKDWQAQIIDILNEKVSSLQSSLEHLHLKNDNALDVVDAIRETGDANSQRLESLHDKVRQIAGDVSSISHDVSSISNQPQGGGDSIPAQRSDVTEIKEHLLFLQRELASIKQQIHLLNERTQTRHQSHPAHEFRPDIPSHGVGNDGDLSDREIDRISRQIGLEWERLGTFLDYETKGQINALKRIYRDQPLTCNFRMIQSWRDMVVSCGENPRTLLAAAFASIQRNDMAESLVPSEQVEVIRDKEARRETKDKIKLINFDIQGNSSISRRSPVMAFGGEGGINVFDGDVTLGSLSIHPSASSSIQALPDPSSLPSGSSIQIGGPGSLNVYGGTVKTGNNQHIQIGQPSLLYSGTSNICRGEGVDVPDASVKSSDSNLKKTVDNTMSKLVISQYNEIMDSVGVLVAFDHLIGTVFRVGSKYVMTAWHCVRLVIDPMKNGAFNFDILKDPQVLVTFNYPSVLPNQTNFSIQNVTYIQTEFDIVILELSEPSKLPPMLKLYPYEIPYMQVQYVDIIGYGHPQSNLLTLDQACKIVLQGDTSIQSAQAWLQQNKEILKRGLKADKDPSSIDWGFGGYDKQEKMIFNCYLEHGSSGAPILTTKCFGGPFVVGVVTNGLPHSFWDLTSTAQLVFPPKYRFEMGTRMTHIYQGLSASNSDIASDLFR